VMLFWQLGLWMFPIGLFVTSDAVLATSNLILTESITISMGIFFAVSFLNLYRRRNEKVCTGFLPKLIFGSLMALSYFLMITTKPNLIVFGLPLLLLIGEYRKKSVMLFP